MKELRPVMEQKILKRGQKIVIPHDAIAPVMVYTREKGARIRFRGISHRLSDGRGYIYGKQNGADEELKVEEGEVEVAFDVTGNVRRVVA